MYSTEQHFHKFYQLLLLVKTVVGDVDYSSRDGSTTLELFSVFPCSEFRRGFPSFKVTIIN